jgi:hypothetical protein
MSAAGLRSYGFSTDRLERFQIAPEVTRPRRGEDLAEAALMRATARSAL